MTGIPLIETGCRQDTAPMLKTGGKAPVTPEAFGTGIDNKTVTYRGKSPSHPAKDRSGSAAVPVIPAS